MSNPTRQCYGNADWKRDRQIQFTTNLGIGGAPAERSNRRNAPNVVEVLAGISEPEGMKVQTQRHAARGTDA